VTAGADVVTRDSAETAVDGLTMADVEMGFSMALQRARETVVRNNPDQCY
jgi:hypothetical protein